MNHKIDVFLLAAGESSRMFPINSILEKSLLPVWGKPVCRYIVDNLVNSGVVREITIVCLDKFRENFEHEFRDVNIPTRIHSLLNPIGTFNTFIDILKNCYTEYDLKYKMESEYVMVHYADCLTNIDYQDFVSSFETRKKKSIDGFIAVTNRVKHDYSEVILGRRDNSVIQFNEKPNISNYTWSGIGLFHTDNLLNHYYKNQRNTDFAFDIFPQMVGKAKLHAYPYNGYWYDMGNLNSYRKVCSMFGHDGDK